MGWSPQTAVADLVKGWPSVGQIYRLEPVPGGLSGATLWRVESAGGQFALKQWPEGIEKRRAQKVHATLQHIAAAGFRRLPVPLPSAQGDTLVVHAGRLWELAPWLSGQPVPGKPVEHYRIEAAMDALAEFHAACAAVPRSLWPTPAEPATAPALVQRGLLLDEWLCQKWQLLSNVFSHARRPDFADVAASLMEQLGRWIEPAARLVKTHLAHRVALQVIAGDIWRNNVLFSQRGVVGFVDFTAMRVDAPVADVVRLLGSLACTTEDWQRGLHAYRGTAPPPLLSSLQLAEPMYVSGLVLTVLNWLWWLYAEKRDFADSSAVFERCRELHEDLLRLDQVSFSTWH